VRSSSSGSVIAASLAACVFVACSPTATAAPAATAAPVTSPSQSTMTPAAAQTKARGFLQHQIDAARGDGKALVASFTSDAVILIEGHASDADGVSAWGIGDAGPDGGDIAAASITKLLASGTADAVWFYAEVIIRPKGPGAPAVTRVAELLVASEQWHAVAASFGMASALDVSDSNLEIPNATGDDGPLAKLLSAPSALGAALAPNAIVIGPTAAQLKQGAGAKDALAGWKLEPIALYKRAREIHTPTWGFVQAYYDHATGKPTDVARGLAQAFALPKPDGSWNIVLVQYRAR